MICRGVSYQKAADTVGVSQSSIARMLAFLGHPCGGVISKIKDFASDQIMIYRSVVIKDFASEIFRLEPPLPKGRWVLFKRKFE